MNPRLALGSTLALGVASLALVAPHSLDGPPRHGRDGGQEMLMLERELPLASGGPLSVDVHDADVSLRAREGETARIRIYAWSEDGDEDWARQVFERADFRVEPEGDGVRVASREVRYDREDWRRHRGFGLRVEVEHPPAVDARIETGDGDVIASRIGGPVRLSTADGDIAADALDGPVVEVATSDGDVRVGEATGRTVRLVTSDGDVDVGRLEAEDAVLETSDGDVVLRRARAGRLRLVSSDGDLVLTELETDDARLETSEGDISVERLAGGLQAVTSEGDVRVALRTAAPLDLVTTEGDISVRVPAGAGFELDLSGGSVTLGGDVRADRTAGRPGQIRATVHGGGPRIRARTSSGDVSFDSGGP